MARAARRGRGVGGPEWAGLSPAPSQQPPPPPLPLPPPPPPASRTQRAGSPPPARPRAPGLRWARMSGFLEELLGEKLVTGGGEEVDVHSLGARGISLLGLYFGCSLSAPCAQLSGSLAAFYGRLRGDAAAGPGAGAGAGPGPGPGAGAAAEPEPRRRLEIVFVSSDQDQRQWQDFVRDMPWLALPYKEKHRKVSGAGLVGAPGLAEQPASWGSRVLAGLARAPRSPSRSCVRSCRRFPSCPSVSPSSEYARPGRRTPPSWGSRGNSSVRAPDRSRGVNLTLSGPGARLRPEEWRARSPRAGSLVEGAAALGVPTP